MSGASDVAEILVVCGPTAAGKSAVGMWLAESRPSTIVSADSRQVYRGFDIGTGKVPAEERRRVPHHLLDCVEPEQVFTAGDYRREALQALESIRERQRLPILVGGTGLYLRALLVGLFEGPRRSERVRARLTRIAARHPSQPDAQTGCNSRRGRFLHRYPA